MTVAEQGAPRPPALPSRETDETPQDVLDVLFTRDSPNTKGLARRPRKTKTATEIAIEDMVASGHGFVVEGGYHDAPVRFPRCEICGDEMPYSIRGEWICEFEHIPMDMALYGDKWSPAWECLCNWCEIGRERAKRPGRPRKQCGKPECETELRRRQQRERRTLKLAA